MSLPPREARHVCLTPPAGRPRIVSEATTWDSTQRQQVEPQMGNHNSNSLTKHLNSFLPVMYITMMTETMLGWSWTRIRKLRYTKSSTWSHTSFWCKAIYMLLVSEDTEGSAEPVFERMPGAHSKKCPSFFAWHSTTPKCYCLLHNILLYWELQTE